MYKPSLYMYINPRKGHKDKPFNKHGYYTRARLFSTNYLNDILYIFDYIKISIKFERNRFLLYTAMPRESRLLLFI